MELKESGKTMPISFTIHKLCLISSVVGSHGRAAGHGRGHPLICGWVVVAPEPAVNAHVVTPLLLHGAVVARLGEAEVVVGDLGLGHIEVAARAVGSVEVGRH